MLLQIFKEIIKTEHRSTDELTAEELSRLYGLLENSDTVKRYLREHRPRRGSRVFGTVSMILLLILKECKRRRFRGAVDSVTAEDAASLGFPCSGGEVRIPVFTTLNHFYNHIFVPFLMDGLIDEFGSLFLNASSSGTSTLDSTPVEASRNDRTEDYNVHYGVRMKKGHIFMADGRPVAIIVTSGSCHDGPAGRDLISKVKELGGSGLNMKLLLGDAAYCGWETYADARSELGVRLVTGLPCNTVYRPDADAAAIDRAVNARWDKAGSVKAMTMDQKLGFLCRNGKEELVGTYLRNIRFMDPEAESLLDLRRDCEHTHSSMKKWIDFTVRGSRVKGRADLVRTKFLCIQALSALLAPA
jgi:hypothetical protein